MNPRNAVNVLRDFEQLSHRLALSLTIPNFRKNQAISDRFIAPSEKNARLMQGQRDGRSLLFAAVYSFFFLKIGSSLEQSQAPTAIAARETKYVTFGISRKMTRERSVPIKGATA